MMGEPKAPDQAVGSVAWWTAPKVTGATRFQAEAAPQDGGSDRGQAGVIVQPAACTNLGVLQFLTPEQCKDVRDGTLKEDLTSPIQKALRAAAGGTLEFPPGHYLCGALRLPEGARLVGQGATLVCHPDTKGNWLQAEKPGGGGSLQGLALDYRHNPAHMHPLSLEIDPRGWRIEGCVFKNMQVSAAIHASYERGGGDIRIQSCRFLNGRQAGALSIRTQRAGLGVAGLAMADCDVLNCGGSLVAITMNDDKGDPSTWDRFGAFRDVTLRNLTLVGDHTGDGGAIPVELWGADHVSVTGCRVERATRGIGFFFCRHVVCSHNLIRNQSCYAHEVGVVQDLVISHERAYNCGHFYYDTAHQDIDHPSRDVVIAHNLMVGTGRTGRQDNFWAIKNVPQKRTKTNISIVGNEFRNLENAHGGAIRMEGTENLLVRGNHLVAEAENCAFSLASVGKSVGALVCDNRVEIRTDFTGAHPSSHDRACVISHGNSERATITGNVITMEGENKASATLFAIGDFDWETGSSQKDLRIERNTITGPFDFGLRVWDTSGTAQVLDNSVGGVAETKQTRRYHLRGVKGYPSLP